MEVPPVPFGHRFVACLTHDVDHPRLRDHKFDHTMFGFLYRALIGSVADRFRGRISTVDVLRDWTAALKLPFVHLGLAKDPWSDFDRYVDIGREIVRQHSLLFPSRIVLVFAPKSSHGSAVVQHMAPRTSPTSFVGLSPATEKLHFMGSTRGRTAKKGHAELAEVRSITGARDIGVRMHWLYFNEESPAGAGTRRPALTIPRSGITRQLATVLALAKRTSH